MICLALTGSSLEENLTLIEAQRPYIDCCELRADFLEMIDPGAVRSFPLRAKLPIILTLRRVDDGGRASLPEAERQALLAAMLSSDYAYVDLEEDLQRGEAEAAAQRLGVRIIRSAHDFKGLPADLSRRIAALPRSADEIPKFAGMPRSVSDLRRLFRSMRETPPPHIILGMGEYGFPSRILAPRYGALLSFCSPEGELAAPGHISPKLLDRLYGYRKVTPQTRLFGVIGNPALHSRSPEIHNSAYRRDGLDALYVPFTVDEPREWLTLAEELGVEGFSVTVPHKERIIPLLAEQDPAVEAIGACNTVVRRGMGWRGSNTDWEGFLAPLLPLLAGDEGRPPRRALLIGAGGAAKAALWALRSRGIEVLITNRTLSKAEELARRFGLRAAPLKRESFPLFAEYGELIVQTTPAGMHPLEDSDPLEGYPWRGTEIAYDLIYVPERTRFLTAAAAAGARILNGAAMLQAQAEAQYRLFTKRDFPIDENQ